MDLHNLECLSLPGFSTKSLEILSQEAPENISADKAAGKRLLHTVSSALEEIGVMAGLISENMRDVFVKNTLGIYVAGSLKNIPNITAFATALKNYLTVVLQFDCPIMGLRPREIEVNTIWTSHGPTPDVEYTKYSKGLNKAYCKAINDPVVKAICDADAYHIRNSDIVICFGPAGKSAYAEMGYARASGKLVFMIKNLENARGYEGIDCMEHFAHGVFCDTDEFFARLPLFMMKESMVPDYSKVSIWDVENIYHPAMYYKTVLGMHVDGLCRPAKKNKRAL